MGNLKNKAVKGVAWNAVSTFANRGISMFFMLFMTRLLLPSDYGLIGMLTVFMAVAGQFIDSGFSQALLKKQNRTKVDEATVFYFNIAASLISYIFLFVIAPFVADFYNMPQLCEILRVLGISLVIGATGTMWNLQYQINLDFKTPSILGLVGNVFSGIVGVVLAYLGYGVWALVYQSLLGTIFGLVLRFFYSTWRPIWAFSWKSFHEFFGYGSKLLLSRLLDTLYNNVYPVVIGKFYSASTLGFYSRAHSLAGIPSVQATQILQGATFPVLCKVNNDMDRLGNAYRRMLKLSVFVIFPLMMGLAILAHPFIMVVFTEKWEYSAGLLTIICFAQMWHPVHAINLNLLQVVGRSDLFLRVELINKFLAIIVIACTYRYSIEIMCFGYIFSCLVSIIINTYYTGKFINCGFWTQIKDLCPSFLLSLAMLALIFGVTYFIPNDILKIIVGSAVGILFYVGLSYIFKFSEMKELILILRRK